ncbi:MAG: ATP-dependent DNA helicase RecG [Pseudomonadota bacterium]
MQFGQLDGPTGPPANPELLLTPLRTVRGVGPVLATRLARLLGRGEGTARRIDLLFHVPQGATEHRLDAEPAPNKRVTIEVTVDHHRPQRGAARFRRKGPRSPYTIRCWTEIGWMDLVYFRAREIHLRDALPEGELRVVTGTLVRFKDRWQMVHPELVTTRADLLRDGPLRPVYPLTEGLTQRALGRVVSSTLAHLPCVPEWQDPAWLACQRWPGFEEAIHSLHRPHSAAHLGLESPARRRLAFDELVANQLALALLRQRDATRLRCRRASQVPSRLRKAVLDSLPFQLTPGQRGALEEIDQDLTAPARMLRLLQGDVGSGKTLVALLAMLGTVESGGQAALLAPTEILAVQHATTLTQLLAPLGLAPTLLTGRERGARRRAVLKQVASGAAKIVVGTHALFQENVDYADLTLAVVDEQHRFGVGQRLEFVAKGDADLLIMSATPIPRTMVLSLYGDMAVSELRSKPPGRQPIETRVMPLGRIEAILKAVEKALERGERLYWVCPRVTGGEDSDPTAAEQRCAMLQTRFGDQVGLVHGQMTSGEKDAAMAAFAAGGMGLLVATTVIEVGVDVPEAGVMVIEHAERFGLAQLHQLRGRVGRGTRRSSCLLLYDEPLGPTARARLEILRATEDGFRIAEEDLRLRGPGELLGSRQSGLPALLLADLAVHADLLAPARDDVRRFLALDPELETPRGQALRLLLQIFERDVAVRYISAG